MVPGCIVYHYSHASYAEVFYEAFSLASTENKILVSGDVKTGLKSEEEKSESNASQKPH